MWIDYNRRRGDHHPHGCKHGHRCWQGHNLTNRLLALAVAEPGKVWHVERKRRPESDHPGQRKNKDWPEFCKAVELALLMKQVADSVRLPQRPTQEQGR